MAEREGEEVPGLRRRLGLFSATMVIVGSMVGSGILLLPAEMVDILPDPWLVLVVFIVAALLTIVGALTVAELSGMMPQAGGQYAYLREAFGPGAGYLYGWTNFWVIMTGTVAAVGAAFGKFVGIVLDLVRGTSGGLPGEPTPLVIGSWTTGLTLPGYGDAYVAVAAIMLLAGINALGVRFGGLIANLSTVAKGVGFALLVAVVFLFSPADPEAFVASPSDGNPLLLMAAALVPLLFAYDGWYTGTYVAGEVRNPQRNVPLALVGGPLITTAIYLSVASAMFYAVSVSGALEALDAGRDLATVAATRALGTGAALAVGILALVSVFGTLNSYILTAPRISYAMAQHLSFLPGLGRLNARGVPAFGLLITAIWSCLLLFTGLYVELAVTVVAAVFAFHVATAAAHLWLRHTKPNWPRPFRTPGGPILPVLFGLSSLGVLVASFLQFPGPTTLALVLGGLGMPVYLLQRRRVTPS